MTTFALRYADRVLFVDPSLMEDAQKNAEVSGTNFIYLPTGYDSEKFKPAGDKEDLIVTVSYISNSVVKRKGLDTFVKAAFYFPEVKFALIGKSLDDAIDFLKRAAPNNVEFPGYLSNGELISYYQRAKVYCQLSAYEGLPNALCEAMLCECVPIGTKCKGIPTAIGDTGFYVPYGNPQSTAKAIEKALNSSNELPRRARQRIMDRFTLQRREKGLVQVIHELSGG